MPGNDRHTFNGTYADAPINLDGQIALIDPRPPAVKDYWFVSLEGSSLPNRYKTAPGDVGRQSRDLLASPPATLELPQLLAPDY